MGFRTSATVAAGPGFSVRVAVPVAVSAWAVIVSVSAVVDAMTFVLYVPSWLLTTGSNVASPLVVKSTVSSVTKRPPLSFTVAVSGTLLAPSAVTLGVAGAIVTVDAAPNWVYV